MDDEHFMQAALALAKKSLDVGEFPVGCVLVAADRIIATGSRSGTLGAIANEVDHAEMAALRQLEKLQERIDPGKISLYSTLEPCLMCFGAILLSGIGKIVYAYEDIMGGGTRCDLTRLPALYQNRSLSIVPNVLRNDSLALFKNYFQNPKTIYWKDSLLAAYTINQ